MARVRIPYFFDGRDRDEYGYHFEVEFCVNFESGLSFFLSSIFNYFRGYNLKTKYHVLFLKQGFNSPSDVF